MAFETIQNHKRAIYLGVKTTVEGSVTTTFNRLGEGINTFTPSNNAQVNTKWYINHKVATNRRTGIQKQWAISGDRVKGDAVNDYLFGLSEKVGADAETEIIIVDLTSPTTSQSSTTYPAKKYACMVDISNDGTVEGGQDITIDGTIYANAEAIEGTAVITEASSSAQEYCTFTASN